MSFQPPAPQKSSAGLWLGGAAILLVALIMAIVLLLNRQPAPVAPAAAVIVSAGTATPELATASSTDTATPTPVSTETPTSTPMPELGTSNLFIEYILDASGSMSETLDDGSPKIEVAQRVLTEHMRSFRPETNIGLRAYGHRLPYQQTAESCRDIELIAPPQRGQMERIASWLQDFTVQGMTPLAASLELAREDFIYDASRINSIVMLSDGIETCGGDPCRLVENLKAQGINFTIHVIGLDVDDPTRQQLSCIAEAGGGTYHDARSQQELNVALGAVQTDVTQDEVIVPPGVNTPTPAPPTATPTQEAGSVLTPGQILFFSNRAFDEIDYRAGQSLGFTRHELYVMDADGSNQRRLSAISFTSVMDQALSEDRTALLVVDQAQDRLKRLNLSNPDTIASSRPGDAVSVAWSPDASQIAFTEWNSAESAEQVWVMNADGTGNRQLTSGSKRTLFVDWSPDGSKLAVPYGYQLHLLSPDGSTMTQIFDGFTRNLAWSPDGSMIAFEGEYRPNGSPYNDLDIWIINADGSNPRNLTNSPDVYDSDPSWSPDGRFIVFGSMRSREAGARTQIVKMDVTTGEVAPLTTQGNNMVPLWVK